MTVLWKNTRRGQKISARNLSKIFTKSKRKSTRATKSTRNSPRGTTTSKNRAKHRKTAVLIH